MSPAALEPAQATDPFPLSPLRGKGARGRGGLGLCEGAAWLEEAARLHRAGTPFVVATVVAREAPQSARSGAKALVLADGSLTGWVGGGCVRPTVLRESLAALRDGSPRLLRINPLAEADHREGVRVYTMTCEGEGAIDVYLEPVLPRPALLVYGRTPVAEALVRLAQPLELVVWRAGPDLAGEPGGAGREDSATSGRSGRRGFAVVATMGEGDAEALRAALAGDAEYVGLVASRRKAAVLLDHLRAEDVAEARLACVKAPAGLDFGASTPAEIALSILAEIVQLQRSGSQLSRSGARAASASAEGSGDSLTALDPVCGMAVDVRAAHHLYEHEGRTYHFCCPHCRAAFVKEPARYATAASA